MLQAGLLHDIRHAPAPVCGRDHIDTLYAQLKSRGYMVMER